MAARMRGKNVLRGFKSHKHRHADCVSEAIAAAEQSCARTGQRLTKLRRRVLELVWAGHKPVKAYEILAQLQRERHGAAPPTVYRALEFLQNEGLVHRIESLNAFVGCGEPARSHSGQFLICRDCGMVGEMDDEELSTVIVSKARRIGFQVDHEMIEIRGLCNNCKG